VSKAEKARIGDVPHIQELVNSFASKGEMLPRALSEIYENLRDYFVIRARGKVIACAALHINWSDLAEIRSVAVSEKKQQQGVGALLLQACFEEAHNLGIAKLFCLTYKPDFFQKLGFRLVDKMELPRKVWSECYQCPHFPDCDEVALVLDLKP
jgi:amino-acid N-acetyltransferase